jgi:mRNA-degrading endonuclease toxin of MazEF toxin-antitoxin module
LIVIPKAGQERRDIHPFLVLSPKNFNDKTSLVIGLPMTTAEYNADNPFAVSVGNASGKKANKKVMCFVINLSLLTGESVQLNLILIL